MKECAITVRKTELLKWVELSIQYFKSKNMARGNSDNSGCGCLIFIIIAIIFVVSRCNDSSSPTKETCPPGRTIDYSNVEGELSEEDKKYEGNSLSTGSTPYVSIYGKNYKCPYNRCSGIKVTAPSGSDIVVIIKRNNQEGEIVAHGYIRSGATYQFDIPDGTYQTFFYYGEGWNPNKDMGDGVKGGFVKNELFSKDDPQEVYSGVLSYVLQLKQDGNFQTKGSNRSEVFK